MRRGRKALGHGRNRQGRGLRDVLGACSHAPPPVALSSPYAGLLLLGGLVAGAAAPTPEVAAPPHPARVAEVADGLARDAAAASARYAAGLADAVVRLGSRAAPPG